MAQPPTGNRMRINWKHVILASLSVVGLALIFYLVLVQLGGFYAWAILFLVFINVYLIYRVSIRQALAERLFHQDEYLEPEDLPSQVASQGSENDIERQQAVYAQLKEDYPTCPNCSSKVIPGLGYCESCGHKIISDSSGN